MAEYISKEYIINKCKEHRELYISAWGDFSSMPKEDKATCDAYATCWSDVVNAPAADVQSVKHGKWMHNNDDGIILCSECEHEAYWDTDYGQQLFDYCPYCGARMDGDT